MTETTSCRSPRLAPDVRLSPHPAQHFQIGLSLSSVAWCAGNLEVLHAICLRWVFELRARYNVVYNYLAWMEWLSFTLTVWFLYGTDRSFEEDCLFSQIPPSLPAFLPMPDLVVCEETFVFNTCLFLLDFFWFGVGVVPGSCYESFGLVLIWPAQCLSCGSEGIILFEPSHDLWHMQSIFSP